MPIYDYICDKCNSSFEQRHKMSFTGQVTCNGCGEPVRKIISAPAVVMDWRDSDSVHESKRFRSAVQNRTARR